MRISLRPKVVRENVFLSLCFIKETSRHFPSRHDVRPDAVSQERNRANRSKRPCKLCSSRMGRYSDGSRSPAKPSRRLSIYGYVSPLRQPFLMSVIISLPGRTPLRKLALPRDVATQIVLLSSGAVSGHVTGQVVMVEGGMEGRVLYMPDDFSLGRHC